MVALRAFSLGVDTYPIQQIFFLRDTRCDSKRTTGVLTRAFSLAVLLFSLFQSESAAAPAANTLNSLEQMFLADRFAPILVFHPAEKYFPCSPLFTLNDSLAGPLDRQLGSPESRTLRYQSMTLEEKAAIATVYYRAYPAKRSYGDAIVVEYWFYYVQDTYRVRGGIIPLWVDGSHPNDLEHVHIVLRAQYDNPADRSPLASTTHLTVDSVYAGAHEGTVPANRYHYSDPKWSERTQFLVELGSHANAPDINQDGMYTPRIDGDSGYKMLWGIRDKGKTWMTFKPSYMLLRSESESPVFSHNGTDAHSGKQFSYRLVSVDELSNEFLRLGLSDTERRKDFETPKSWFKRFVGKSDGNSDKLLVPRNPRIAGRSVGIENFSSTERGFMVGGTNLFPDPGFFLGGRYSFLNGKKIIPDLIFEADGIVTKKGKGYFSTQSLMSYPIEGSTRFFVGHSFVTDSLSFKRREWDWIGGFEVRLGRVRVYFASRPWGEITRSAVDFRMAYFF